MASRTAPMGALSGKKPSGYRFLGAWLLLTSSAWAVPVTLPEALTAAQARSPILAAEAAALAEAEARVHTAAAWPHNPELGVEGAARLGAGDPSADWQVRLSQTLPLGGQRGRQIAVARAERDEVAARWAAELSWLTVRVRLAFVDLLFAQAVLAVETVHSTLAQSLVGMAERRFNAGVNTRLEVGLARVEAGRAAGRVAAARGQVRVASSRLAEAMGGDPSAPIEAVGDLAPAEVPPPALAPLLAAAHTRRSELIALERGLQTARARVAAAEAAAVPDLTISVFGGRESGRETLVGAGLSVPLPLFDPRRASEARAAEPRLAAERALVAARVEQEVVAAWSELTTAIEVETTLRAQVTEPQDTHLDLLRRAFDVGKIAGSEVLVMQNEFRASHLEWLAACAEVHRARARLDLAVGPPDGEPAP